MLFGFGLFTPLIAWPALFQVGSGSRHDSNQQKQLPLRFWGKNKALSALSSPPYPQTLIQRWGKKAQKLGATDRQTQALWTGLPGFYSDVLYFMWAW